LAAEASPDYKIEILGINWNLSNTTSNDLVTTDNDLPWLQDTVEENVQLSWAPVYRDVVILNPVNETPVAAFNLSTYDLAIEANRTQLKALLLSVAELEDADGDKLSDFWEDEMFDGDRSSGPNDNTDGDSSIEVVEYALGSHAGDPASLPQQSVGIQEDGGDQYPTITFRRRLGAAGGAELHRRDERDACPMAGRAGRGGGSEPRQPLRRNGDRDRDLSLGAGALRPVGPRVFSRAL